MILTLPVDFCFGWPPCAAVDRISEAWDPGPGTLGGWGSSGRRSGPGEAGPGAHQSGGSWWPEDPPCPHGGGLSEAKVSL